MGSPYSHISFSYSTLRGEHNQLVQLVKLLSECRFRPFLVQVALANGKRSRVFPMWDPSLGDTIAVEKQYRLVAGESRLRDSRFTVLCRDPQQYRFESMIRDIYAALNEFRMHADIEKTWLWLSVWGESPVSLNTSDPEICRVFREHYDEFRHNVPILTLRGHFDPSEQAPLLISCEIESWVFADSEPTWNNGAMDWRHKSALRRELSQETSVATAASLGKVINSMEARLIGWEVDDNHAFPLLGMLPDELSRTIGLAPTR